MPNRELSQRSPTFPTFLRRRSTLIFAFVLLAVAAGLPLLAQNPGYDFFRTSPTGSKFTFSGDLALPAGFFGPDSPRYSATIALKGVPIRTFRDHKTGKVDTIVERKSAPPAATKFPAESKTEVSLAALSLASAQPIKVRVGKKTELWDVKVEASPSHPSTGSMTFTQRNKKGGTAQSELAVYPLFTFTRRGDKAEKTLDTGKSQLGAEATKQLTLHASNIPWTRTEAHGPLSDGIVVGSASIAVNESSNLANHRVITIPNPILH